jgi:hypothetical protein
MSISIVPSSCFASRSDIEPRDAELSDNNDRQRRPSFAPRLKAVAKFVSLALTMGVTIAPLKVAADEWASGGGPVHGPDGCAMAELQSLSTYGPQPHVYGCSPSGPTTLILFNANGEFWRESRRPSDSRELRHQVQFFERRPRLRIDSAA